jgi:uncharacterized protein (DUF697 family)
MALPIRLGVLRALVKEVAVDEGKPLLVGGARELAAVLARELGRDARPGAVRAGDEPEGGAVFVYVLGREPSEEDERALTRARRARVPIIAVVAGPISPEVTIPFVLATDVVRVGAGEGFPLAAIASTIARRLGEDAAPLAARVPLLRRAVADRLVASFSLRNAIVGAAVFVRGADLPVLALNELRLVLRLEQAYGLQVDPRERLPEIAAVVGVGFGLRALARRLLDLVPEARWVVKGAVAYAGTRALGEAAVRRLEAAPSGRYASRSAFRPQRGGASRGGP